MRVGASKIINAEPIAEKLKKLNDQLTHYLQLLKANDQQEEQLNLLGQQETAYTDVKPKENPKWLTNDNLLEWLKSF